MKRCLSKYLETSQAIIGDLWNEGEFIIILKFHHPMRKALQNELETTQSELQTTWPELQTTKDQVQSQQLKIDDLTKELKNIASFLITPAPNQFGSSS